MITKQKLDQVNSYLEIAISNLEANQPVMAYKRLEKALQILKEMNNDN